MLNKKLLPKKVLYSSNSGSLDEVTLSDIAANYEYLEIIYVDDQNFQSSIKIKSNASSFLISMVKSGARSDIIYLNSTRFLISNNKLIANGTYILSITPTAINSLGTNNLFKIIEVLGYK